MNMQKRPAAANGSGAGGNLDLLGESGREDSSTQSHDQEQLPAPVTVPVTEFDWRDNDMKMSEYATKKIAEIAKATDATIVGPAAPRKSPFDTRVYQSTHVTGSQNVQIGSGNTQTVTFVDKLNAANVAIDHSTATMEEKRETKSLLKRLSENKFLASVLALVFSHHSAS